MTTPRKDLALFLDCEMTDNSDEGEIIEVGCSMRETDDWTEVGYYRQLVVPSTTGSGWERMLSNDVVRNMHTVNGLIADLEWEMSYGTPAAKTIDVVDRDLEQWLDTFLEGDKTHIPYGGSGVAHFDRPYIKRQMPRLNKRITFWAYDSGNDRRKFRLAGRPWLASATSDLKTHRALDDARMHAEEWRYSLIAIKTAFDPEVMAQFETTHDF